MSKKRRPRQTAVASAPASPRGRASAPVQKRKDRAAIVRTALLAGLVAGAAVIVGLIVVKLEGDPHFWDTDIYRRYGNLITAGHVPYRDFAVEYPPGALVPFVLPALFSSKQAGYDPLFQGLMVISLAAASVLVLLSLQVLGAPTRRIALSLAGLWGGTLLLGPFLMTRFDFFVVAVTLAATYAILCRRAYLGPVLLGVSISTKIYPVVLVPLLVVRTARLDGRAAGLRALGVTVGTALLVYLPFAVLAPVDVARSVWRQAGRGLQIESLGSGVLLGLHHAFGMPLGWANGGGSQNLTGTVASVTSAVTTIAGVAALLLVWVRFARGDAESGARFARYAAAATVAFVAFGKVLSPQFLLWLLVAVALALGRRGTLAMALVVIACGLTRFWFPWHYLDLVTKFDPTLSWLVLTRDLVLVAAFAALVVPTAVPQLIGRQPARRRAQTVAPTIRSRPASRRPTGRGAARKRPT
jgi:hypothetical protein